ncbi:MAG TPA: amidase [Rhizomicrobium sp.]
MAFAEYDKHDGLGLAHLVRRKAVSPLELLDEAIARVEKHNPKVNAVVYKAYDEARKTAQGKLPEGPFKGVPFLIKDIGTPVNGWPMTSGSAFLKDYVTHHDGELTKRYRSAGMVLFGKTNTPEFGIPGTTEGRHLGICRNPWNPGHSSGGSSGGAAAAVSSGMVPMAHGSDGLGSIRIPSAQCGLVGMKPTQFRNPGGPDDRGRAHGLICDHVLTRSVRDSAAMLDWTGTPEDDAPYAPVPKARPFMDELATAPGKLRIAFSTEVPRGIDPTPDVQKVFDDAVKLLGELGHTMIPLPKMPIDWRKLYAAQGAVSGAMFAASVDDMAKIVGREPTSEDFELLAWVSYRGARKITASQVGEGLQQMRLISRHILALWRDFDVLLSPVTLAPPPKIGYLDPVNVDPKEFNYRQSQIFGYTPPFNMTGQPSMSLPMGMSSDTLPIGMMFTGRYSDEATLYRLAAQIEEARPWQPWADHKPQVWG